MVQGGDALLQRPDPEEHIERLALAAEGFTSWGSVHAIRSGVRGGICAKLPGLPRTCEAFHAPYFPLRPNGSLKEPLFTPVEA